jgi:tetratricopeptide (TPR) repeat protein
LLIHRIYSLQHNDEGALTQFPQAIDLKLDHARALNRLGKMYLKRGGKDKAREAFEAALKANPGLVASTELVTMAAPEPVKKVTVKGRIKSMRKLSVRTTAPKKKKRGAGQ